MRMSLGGIRGGIHMVIGYTWDMHGVHMGYARGKHEKEEALEGALTCRPGTRADAKPHK